MKRFWMRQIERGTQGLPGPLAARIRTFNRATFSGRLVLGGYALAFLATGMPRAALALAPNLVWHALLPYFMRKQRLVFARTFSLIVANGTVFILASILGREWGVQRIFFALAVVPLAIYEARERAALVSTLCLPTILAIAFELSTGPNNTFLHSNVSWPHFMAMTITSFVLLLGPIRIFVRETWSYQTQLHAAKESLEREIERRHQLESELENGRRVAALGELAAGVAHEINTPLQYVTDGVSFLDLSAKRLLSFAAAIEEILPELDEKHRAPLQEQAKRIKLSRLRDEHLKAWIAVENGLSSISEIVVAMKALARSDGEHGGRSEADINEILRNAALVTRGQWGAVADLSFELDESLPLVPVLAGELGLVFTNLIINASHAVIDRAADARGKISIHSYRRADRVEIEVRDSGCGIRDEIKDRVFEPFFTTKEVGRGSGQGLSLAYTSIVQRHGGRLSFESSAGTGTTFRVTLPIQAAIPSASSPGRARWTGEPRAPARSGSSLSEA